MNASRLERLITHFSCTYTSFCCHVPVFYPSTAPSQLPNPLYNFLCLCTLDDREFFSQKRGEVRLQKYPSRSLHVTHAQSLNLYACILHFFLLISLFYFSIFFFTTYSFILVHLVPFLSLFFFFFVQPLSFSLCTEFIQVYMYIFHRPSSMPSLITFALPIGSIKSVLLLFRTPPLVSCVACAPTFYAIKKHTI